jgi:hypothetical protein
VRSSVLVAAAFFLSFHLLAAASAHAQGPQSEMRSKPPPSSGIAHNFFTWLHHVTGAGPHRHRIVSAPPLPRPRPAQLAKVPVELPAAAVEPNKAQPAAPAVVPNDASAALAPTAAEPDREPGSLPAAAVEPSEAQPAAALMPSAPGPAVEPDKAAAEVPPRAVEQTKATPGTSTGTAVEGANIPD